jgi:hypothetical protein
VRAQEGPWGLVLDRLTREVTAALRRRPPAEERLAGVLRAVGARSELGRALLADAASTLARRGGFARPLFLGAIRALTEIDDGGAVEPLLAALAAEEVTLSVVGAACFCSARALKVPLLRAASSRSPQLAFAAEVARLRRGEARGEPLAALALRLKEASRIELCADLFWPLLQEPSQPAALAPALVVLRDADRHLGRWLLLAELAVRAGDLTSRQHAQRLARQGPVSARGAWALVDWALSGDPSPPGQKSPLDVLIRLSDRPTTERDLSFLFRLAEVRALQLQAHLQGAAERVEQGEERGIRAAFFLIRDHGRDDLRASLRKVLRGRREGSWGLATAALHDLDDEGADEAAERCLSARSLTAVAWGGLVKASLASERREPLLTECRYRHLHLGLLA